MNSYVSVSGSWPTKAKCSYRSLISTPEAGRVSNPRWWYKIDGTPYAYTVDEATAFYMPSGQPLGYRRDNWVFSESGQPIAFFGNDGKWLYTQNGHPLAFHD